MKTDLLQHSSFSLHPFFSRFDQFADAPDAVATMRELVRHLAVTGTLVDQDDKDEPALALLNRISTHKTALAKEGKLRGSTTVAPMSQEEGTRVLPSSWTWVRFGEVMVNRDGERIPVSKEERATKEKTYDYYGASGVIDKIDGYLFDKPLLLIGEDGANLINRSTPIAFMARGQYWVNNHAHVLDGISEDFLRYIELHINAINLEPYVTGSAQPKMNQAKMNSIPIALPPLAEQKRIVAKVDELMALCDRLALQQQERETRHAALARASLARFAEAPTPANLPFLFHPSYAIRPADLRKSILTLAVQGKLVPQDPDDEPAEKDSECKSPFDIPSDWRWKPLGRLGLCRTGKTPPTGDPTNYGLGFPFIGPGQITLTGRFIASEKSITPQGLENSTEAKAGDILMVCIGGSIGKAAICREPIGFNQQINAVRLQQDLPEFVYLAVTADYFQDQVLANASGSATPIINKGKWEQIPIPLPPLAEQRRIVAKVEQLMALVDALETQLAASRTTAANLLSALVAELTGTPSNGKISVPSASVTGRRGRPPKS